MSNVDREIEEAARLRRILDAVEAYDGSTRNERVGARINDGPAPVLIPPGRDRSTSHGE